MNTTVSPTSTVSVPETTVPTIADAVANLLHAEAASFHALVKACRVLATADAASTLSTEDRILAASKVVVPSRRRKGYTLSMSRGTYSKRLKVGRATVEQVEDFEASCDGPTLDKFYTWLPKAEHLSRAKGTGRRVTAVPAETDGPAAEPKPEPVTKDDAPRLAREFLAGLKTRGADVLTINLVIAELDRLVTPVRSVKDAA